MPTTDRCTSDTERSLESHVHPFAVHEMRFADQHKDAILNSEKTLTVRLSGEWRSLTGGDGLTVLDEAGNQFAEARVKRARTFPAKEAFHIAEYHTGHGGHGGDMQAFFDEMNGYYPEAEIGEKTDLKVVHFSLIAPSTTDTDRSE